MAASAVVLLGSKRLHVAFTDSRGEGVHELILRLNKSNEYFELERRDEATLEELIDMTSTHLKDHPFDVVFIAGGINNIIEKVKG